jgi:hypothetical protein
MRCRAWIFPDWRGSMWLSGIFRQVERQPTAASISIRIRLTVSDSSLAIENSP